MDASLSWSMPALIECLYGFHTQFDKSLRPIGQQENFELIFNGKKVRTNLFAGKALENISAIMFSNQATLGKFNRMGKLARKGMQNIKMVVTKHKFDLTTGKLTPIIESSDLDSPDYSESCTEGIIMLHNPNALYPIDIKCFTTISHVKNINEMYIRDDYVSSSNTLVIKSKKY